MTCSRLGAYASRPGHHAVNMLTEERAAPLQATSWRTAPMQLHGCARHCRVACFHQSPQSFQILRIACAEPAAQSPGDAQTCVSSYGLF